MNKGHQRTIEMLLCHVALRDLTLTLKITNIQSFSIRVIRPQETRLVMCRLSQGTRIWVTLKSLRQKFLLASHRNPPGKRYFRLNRKRYDKKAVWEMTCVDDRTRNFRWGHPYLPRIICRVWPMIEALLTRQWRSNFLVTGSLGTGLVSEEGESWTYRYLYCAWPMVALHKEMAGSG